MRIKAKVHVVMVLTLGDVSSMTCQAPGVTFVYTRIGGGEGRHAVCRGKALFSTENIETC